MTVYEMAEKYYPRLWSKDRLDELVGAGKLSSEERDEIVTHAAGAPQNI